MKATLETAGERLLIESALPWVSELVREGAGGELREPADAEPSVTVHVEKARGKFAVDGWDLLARGVWHRRGEVVVENACTSGFDLHVRHSNEQTSLTCRWNPPPRDRAAARVLRSRFHLLARAVLLQYPALWRAGLRGRAPLHASACETAARTSLVTAQSGIGRSTLLLDEVEAGARITGDNLGVGEGTTLWGLVEPMRVKNAGGRRMPHGRSETSLQDRAAALEPECLVVLVRGQGDQPSLTPCTREAAANALAASTYMAGELRRYWAFAATLAAGTGASPVHPPVATVASTFAATVPCFTLALGREHGASLSELLASAAFVRRDPRGRAA
jgi:hypothetical protein